MTLTCPCFSLCGHGEALHGRQHPGTQFIDKVVNGEVGAKSGQSWGGSAL